jgi:hypothetical protein
LKDSIKQLLKDKKHTDLSEEEPTVEEVQIAINSVKSNKAIGNDNLPVELLQYGGKQVTQKIHEIISRVWNGGEIPEDWITTSITTLYKGKGEKSSMDSYRGISVQSHACKVLCEILKNRINPLVNEIVGEYQSGFRQGRGTEDALFVFRMITQKSRKQGQTMHTCFIDLIKAFDSCDWDIMLVTLRELGVPENMGHE